MTTYTDEMMRERLAKAASYTLVMLHVTDKYGMEGADKIIWEHGRRNMELQADGVLPVVCPVGDETGLAGVGIFVDGLDEVRKIMDGDPAIQAAARVAAQATIRTSRPRDLQAEGLSPHASRGRPRRRRTGREVLRRTRRLDCKLCAGRRGASVLVSDLGPSSIAGAKRPPLAGSVAVTAAVDRPGLVVWGAPITGKSTPLKQVGRAAPAADPPALITGRFAVHPELVRTAAVLPPP